jgi:hypothetical protein
MTHAKISSDQMQTWYADRQVWCSVCCSEHLVYYLPLGVFFFKLFENLKSKGNKNVTALGVLSTLEIS